MNRAVVTGLAALALLAPLAGFATAQVVGSGIGGLAGKPATLPSEPIPVSATMTGMLAAQNEARSRLGLPALIWSSELAAKADATVKDAAKACSMSGAEKAGRTRDASMFWAAPLARFGGGDVAQDISAAYLVSRWREGRSDYDIASAKCRTGEAACEPYSRMVAPKAKSVGCAKQVCASQAQVWACHYSQ